MNVKVKICGLTTPETIDAAVAAGAAYIGFMFFPKSPRHLDIARAAELAVGVPPGVCKVAVTVDADDSALDAILDRVPIDMLQLHGHETPERVAAVRQRYGQPIMKVVGVADEADLAQLVAYGRVADQLLVEAKPPKGADRPGGLGLSFDWRLVAGRRWPVPWLLAGGLRPDNVAEAVRLTGARQVDVSSGVESAPGVKDPALIRDFIAAAG